MTDYICLWDQHYLCKAWGPFESDEKRDAYLENLRSGVIDIKEGDGYFYGIMSLKGIKLQNPDALLIEVQS